jgi:hypothetical protein
LLLRDCAQQGEHHCCIATDDVTHCAVVTAALRTRCIIVFVECAELLLHRALMSVELSRRAAIPRRVCGNPRVLYFLYTSFRLVQLVKHNCELKMTFTLTLTAFFNAKTDQDRSVLNDLRSPSSVSATMRVQPPAHGHCPITNCCYLLVTPPTFSIPLLLCKSQDSLPGTDVMCVTRQSGPDVSKEPIAFIFQQKTVL